MGGLTKKTHFFGFIFTPWNCNEIFYKTEIVWFSSIWPEDRTLSDATTLGESGSGIDGNKRVLCIPQSSSINATSPPDCLVSYPGHSFGGGVLPLCRESVSVFYSPRELGKL